MHKSNLKSIVRYWLISGVVLIFFQIILGGITRLTESGLSITKWELVTGTLPPLNADQWNAEFALYKATPQYSKINEGMTLQEFKRIYFWEYLHRLWARAMGFIFLIPFLLFVSRGWIDKFLRRRLLVTVALAALVGAFGWVMVASGLVNRPWVNAYKLTIHLGLALILYSYHFNTVLITCLNSDQEHPKLRRAIGIFLMVLALQIFFGGIMSGMKASLSYPTFPDFHGEFIPSVLLDASNWNVDNIVNYDESPFMAGLIQVLHRCTAYVLIIMLLWIVVRFKSAMKLKPFYTISTLWIILLVSQILLGVAVLLGSFGTVPVLSGVLHQGCAIALLSCTLLIYFKTRKRVFT